MSSQDENLIINADVVTGDSVAKVEKLDASLAGLGDTADKASTPVARLGDTIDVLGKGARDILGPIQDDAMSIEELGAMAGVTGKSMGSLTAEMEANRVATLGAAEANVRALQSMDALQIHQNRLMQSSIDVASAHTAADKAFGPLYKKLTYLESMGTPAILKTATWGALGVAGVGYYAIKQYTDFNRLVTQSITQAGRSMSEMPFLSSQVLAIAKETGASITDVANTLYRAASGTAAWHKGLGASKEELAGIVKQISYLNVLGNVQGGAVSEQAARSLTALVNANLKDVGVSPIRGAALINAAVGAGDIRQSELTSGIGRGLLTSAQINGVGAVDMLSWLDLLTSYGTTGSVAGNYVRTGINLLNHPGTQGTKALAMLGIKAGQVEQIMSTQGLQAAAEFMAAKLGEKSRFMPTPNFPKFGGKTGDAAALKLLQNWGANTISPRLISDWQAGHLTPQEDLFIKGLIMTRTFGGSRQMMPIAALLAAATGADRLQGIEGNIRRNATTKHYLGAVKTAENTPALQFHKDWIGIQVALIHIGQAITPTALKIANGAAHLVEALTKMKVVLYPLLAGIASAIGMAMLSKGAGLVKGMYPLFGASFKMMDSVYGGLSHIPGMGWIGRLKGRGGNLGEGGNIRDTFGIGGSKAWAKTGDDVLKFGSGVNTFDASVTRFAEAVAGRSVSPMGGAMGGGMVGAAERGAGMAGAELGAADRAILEHLATTSNITSEEYGVLKSYISSGRNWSKTNVAGWLPGGKKAGGWARAAAIHDKFSGMVAGPGELNLASREAFNSMATPVYVNGAYRDFGSLPVNARGTYATLAGAASGAEGAALAGGAEHALLGAGTRAVATEGASLAAGGIADFAGSALGFLGGPIGMIAIPAIMSAVMPTVGKWLGNWLHGPVVPGAAHPHTVASNKALLAQIPKNIQAIINRSRAGGNISASDAEQLKWFNQEYGYTKTEQQTFMRNPGTQYKVAARQLAAMTLWMTKYADGGNGGYNLLTQSATDSNGNLLPSVSQAKWTEIWQKKIYPNLPIDMQHTLQKRWHIGASSTGPGTQDFWGNNAIGQWLLKTQPKFVGTVDSMAAKLATVPHYQDYLDYKTTKGLQSHLLSDGTRMVGWRPSGLSYGQSMHRFSVLEMDAARARAFSIQDLSMSRNRHLTQATRDEYSKLGNKLEAQSKRMADAATKIAVSNHLTNQDVQLLAQALGTVLTNAGITPNGFASALTSALVNGKAGLATLVNAGNADLIARNAG